MNLIAKDLNRFRGCLIGGAVGDALGYPVEFMNEKEIFEKYGESGITKYELKNGTAQISDDTQMTLFTANGLLHGTTRYRTRGIGASYTTYISKCYSEWIRTQVEKYPLADIDGWKYSWLINIPQLFSPRDPGRSCTSALLKYYSEEIIGSIEKPINDSKGCGGIMRVAPIGLYLKYKKYSLEEVDMIGAEVAALTYGHELGYITSAMFVHIIQILCEGEDLLKAINSSIEAINNLFPASKYKEELINIVSKAIKLCKKDMRDIDAITELGEGWVAEETLAIALYCSLKYQDDFEKGIIASVNHNGDSDSTGSVTGNILGTILGIDKIPQRFLENLELKDIILEMADDLYKDCPISEYSSNRDENWEKKYIKIEY